MAGQTAPSTIIYEGCFDAAARGQINTAFTTVNTNLTNSGTIVASTTLLTQAATGFGTPITLLATGHPAGTYRIAIYAVVTTTITTATSWLFTLAFTDDKQAQTPTLSTSSTMTAGAVEIGNQLIRSTGATALTYTPTAASAGAGAVTWSIVVERLL